MNGLSGSTKFLFLLCSMAFSVSAFAAREVGVTGYFNFYKCSSKEACVFQKTVEREARVKLENLGEGDQGQQKFKGEFEGYSFLTTVDMTQEGNNGFVYLNANHGPKGKENYFVDLGSLILPDLTHLAKWSAASVWSNDGSIRMDFMLSIYEP